MAARGEDEQAEAGTLNAVWPPPPTCAPVETAPQHRLLLPIYLALPQMLKGFDLPKWAKSASTNIMLVLMVFWLAHKAPVVGKIFVGLLTFVYSTEFLYLLTWAFFVALHLLRRSLGQKSEAPSTSWGHTLSHYGGGWMGVVPSLMFLIWGLTYLGVCHIHRVNRVALAVWGSWFLLGCGVAVVNGVGQWWRGRHAPPGMDHK